jgi:hypothetical protein
MVPRQASAPLVEEVGVGQGGRAHGGGYGNTEHGLPYGPLPRISLLANRASEFHGGAPRKVCWRHGLRRFPRVWKHCQRRPVQLVKPFVTFALFHVGNGQSRPPTIGAKIAPSRDHGDLIDGSLSLDRCVSGGWRRRQPGDNKRRGLSSFSPLSVCFPRTTRQNRGCKSSRLCRKTVISEGFARSPTDQRTLESSMSIASPSQARTACVMRCNGSTFRAVTSFNARKLSQIVVTCAIGDLIQTAYSA